MQDWGTLLQFDLQFYLSSGNVQAVLVRGNRPYILTKDHTPYNKKEKNRVLKDGKHEGNQYHKVSFYHNSFLTLSLI